MEILQLKYFEDVAKKENISHTAQSFMVPPSSVSVAIKKLEAELGVKLFDRTANSLKLNANGRIFLRAVESAGKEIKKARIDMANLAQMPFGKVNLLILTNRRIVTDTIAKFKQKYPEVSFNIKHDGHEGDNKFDIIISDRAAASDMFERRNFVYEEIFLAVNSKAKLAGQSSISLKNLKNEKLICMAKGSRLREYMDKALKKNNVEPDIVIECDDPYYIREYVKMGLGVTFFPYTSWGRHLDDKIKLLRINDGMFRRSYMYINNESSNIARIFAETMEISLQENEK